MDPKKWIEIFIHSRGKRLKLISSTLNGHCPNPPPGYVFIGEFEDDDLGCICVYQRVEPPAGVLIIPCAED